MQLLLLLSAKSVYTQPVISSFTPTTGGWYANITITGSNFSNVTAVKFGGTPAKYFFTLSTTSIVAYVDTGSSGDLTVQTTSGVASKPGFIFLLPPAIKSFTPVTGSIGTNLIIKGSKFTGASAVNFGGINAQSFMVASDSVINAIVGDGASGLISVTNSGGSGYLDGFTHLGPAIISYLPGGGPAGTQVTIRGHHFTAATSVAFQEIPARSFTVLSDSVIKAVINAGSLGIIKVSSPSGAGSIGGFNIPKITSFNPASGSYNSPCTINGINFTGAIRVSFGDTTALAFTIVSDSVIVTRVGTGAIGTIKISNTYGTGISNDLFNFIQLPPTTNSFSPDSGSAGTIVNIKGTHLSGTRILQFGNTNASSFSILTDSTIKAVVGDGSSGNLQIYNQAGNSTGPHTFTFTGPQISSFTPQNASPGDTITINGSNFVNISFVHFGGTVSPYFVVVSTTQIKAVVGIGSSGIVQVTAALGTTAYYGFYMKPQILSFYPRGTGQDSTVTVRGKFFSGLNNVNFGGVNAPSFSFISDSVITAIVPANAYSGNVNISTFGGGAAFLPGFTFVRPPEIDGFFPAVGGIDSVISIFGHFLDSVTDVKIGGVEVASFTIISSTLIKAVLGAGGASDPVTVKSGGGIYSSPGFHYYQKPVITSFTPARAGPMDIVTIKGNHLNSSHSDPEYVKIKFGDSAAADLQYFSDSLIMISAGSGATGNIFIQTPGGVDSIKGFTYLPVPVISSIDPPTAPKGSSINIAGNNFSQIPDSNIVYFGSVRAIVTAATNTSLTVMVPAGVTYEPLSITVFTKTTYSRKPFVVTYPGAAGFSSKTYATKVDIAVAYKPTCYLADIDGDGKLDMVVSNIEHNTIAIYKNNSSPGLISFEPKIEFYTGVNTDIQQIKDINGDGKQDILYLHDTLINGLLSVLKNISSSSGINFLNIDNAGLQYRPQMQTCTLSDINKDGKPDILCTPPNYTSTGREFIQRFQSFNTERNIQYDLIESFYNVSNGSEILNHSGRTTKIITADLDNDGINELLIGLNSNVHGYFSPYFTILKKTGNLYSNTFSKTFVSSPNLPTSNPKPGDLNMDSLPDIICGDISLLNTGNLTFSQQPNTCSDCDFITDMDGDGKPDLGKLREDSFDIVRNKTVLNGNITLMPAISFPTGAHASHYAIGDIDGDGKPDIIISRFLDSTITILRNKSGESVTLCPGGSAAISSNISGNSYQWQLNTGNGFFNIADNGNRSGTNSAVLHLSTIRDSDYGYTYRCMVGTQTSYLYTIKFEDNWTGNINSAWENPANWSCAVVPGANTDVNLNSGNVIISSNVTIKSLIVNPGVILTVSPGNSVFIAH